MVINKDNTISTIGTVLEDGTILEALYDFHANKSVLAISINGKVQYPLDRFQDPEDGQMYVPMLDEEIRRGTVLLPTQYINHVNKEELLKEIQAFIKLYIDLPDHDLYLCALYVLNTWVYDLYEKVPYLRFIGQRGSGKSRILKVLGAISYHSIDLGAGSSEAAMYRMIDRYDGGTVFYDEGNLDNTSVYSPFVKIFNKGNERESAIIKCDLETLRPRSLRLHCPKVIANHTLFQDAALESRMFSVITQPTTLQQITVELPVSRKWDQAINLRNKLLSFRLSNRNEIDTTRKYAELDSIDPRMREIILPLLRTGNFKEIPRELLAVMVDIKQFFQAFEDFDPDTQVARELLKFLEEGRNEVDYSEIKNNLNTNNQIFLSDVQISQILLTFGARKHRINKRTRYFIGSVKKDYLRSRYTA